MRVARWGNSLGVRLPADEVRRLGLTEGDEVEITIDFPVRRKAVTPEEREEVLKRIAAMSISLPEGWKFDRDEANER